MMVKFKHKNLTNAQKIQHLMLLLETCGNKEVVKTNSAVLDDVARIIFAGQYPSFVREMDDEWETG